MIKTKSILAAALMALAMVAPATAQDHGVAEIQKQPWTFAGVFGTYDENQLQRGFQIFRESCSSCHSARLLAFRNLAEPGGPSYSEEQVKALAAEYQIADPEVASGSRPGAAADHWPSPFASEAEAREANGGALPPDLSVIAKARGVATPFPWWILNYFTGYSEGGPDYIHALLNGYHEEPPPGTEDFPADKFYNEVFPGHAIGMVPPLQDGLIAYEDPSFPQTADQYSRDVASFLMWVAEPHLVDRKETGFKVLLFLVLFAGLMWLVKRRLWSRVAH